MRHWKLFIVLCVSLFGITQLPQPNALGCGFYPYETVRAHELAPSHISFFPSDIGGDPRLARYTFVTHPESLWETENLPSNEESQPGLKETNLQEWRIFLMNQVSLEAIEDLIYRSELLSLEHARHRIAQGTPLPKHSNAMLLHIQATKQLPVLDYIIYAKRCEPFAVYDDDPWNFTETMAKRRDPLAMKGLMEQGLSLYSKTASPFLKLRYGYQITRLAHYAGLYGDCIRSYDRLIAGLNVTSVYRYQAMRHKAAAHKRLGQRAEALVLISLVFDQSNPLMDEAYREFFRPTPEEWSKALQSSGHPHRQGTLWLLLSLREQERINLEPLQALYQLEPRSLRLESLLIRGVNIIEKNLVDTDVFHGNTPMAAEKSAYIQDFIAFLQSVDKSRVRQPALWHIAEGYLQLLLKNYTSAHAAIDQVETLTHDDRLTGLAYDLKSLIALAQAKKISAKLEDTLLPTIQRYRVNDPSANRGIITRSYLMVMAQKYFQNGQFAKGYSCISRTGYANLAESLLIATASPKDLDRLMAFMNNKAKSPFDTFINQEPLYSLDDVLAVRGTKLISEDRFHEALDRLAQVSPDYWNDPLYPIATNFKKSRYNARTGLYDYPEGGFRQYTKVQFVHGIVSLLDLAAKEPQAADQCYYQIANAFFHTAGWSYFDLRWPRGVWFEGSKTNPKYPFNNEKLNRDLQIVHPFNPPWTHRQIAWKYYEKARSITKNKELAAECAFLAAACQTQFARQEAFIPKGQGLTFYYDLLRTKYADTAYYRDVVKECSTFMDYLGNR